MMNFQNETKRNDHKFDSSSALAKQYVPFNKFNYKKIRLRNRQ